MPLLQLLLLLVGTLEVGTYRGLGMKLSECWCRWGYERRKQGFSDSRYQGACFVLLFLFVEEWPVFWKYAIEYCVIIEYCGASGSVFIWLLLHLYVPWTIIFILVDIIWISHLSPCKRTNMWHIRGQRTIYSVLICCQMVHPMYSLLHILAVTYAWRYYLVKRQALYQNSTIHILLSMLFHVFHHHVDDDGYSVRQ